MTITTGVYSCLILVLSFGFAKAQQCAAGEYRSNPNNCNGFLQCVHGSLVEMPCAAGLHWNDRIKVCDWPQNARCRVTTTSPSPATITTDIPITTEKHPTETVTEEQGCALGEYRPNPNNCNGFLQCVHGSFVAMPCPAGLQWNDRVQTCDWPQNAKCTVTTISPPPTTTEIPTTATEEQLPEKTTEERPIEEQPFETTSSASNITPVCRCGEHLPSQNECADFYRCEDNVLVLHTCPLGLHWNTELEVCDWPYSANCTLHTSEEPISTITTDTPEPTTDTPTPTTDTPAPTTTTSESIITTTTPKPTQTTTPKPTTTTTTPAPTTTTTTPKPTTTTTTPAPTTTTTTPKPTTTTTTPAPTTTTTTPKPTTTTTTPAPTTTTTTPKPTTTTTTKVPTTTTTTPKPTTTTTTKVPTTTTTTPAPTEEDDYDEDDSEEITLPSWFPDS